MFPLAGPTISNVGASRTPGRWVISRCNILARNRIRSGCLSRLRRLLSQAFAKTHDVDLGCYRSRTVHALDGRIRIGRGTTAELSRKSQVSTEPSLVTVRCPSQALRNANRLGVACRTFVAVWKGSSFTSQDITSALIPCDQGLSNINHRHANTASAAFSREAFCSG